MGIQKINPPVFIVVLIILAGLLGSFRIYKMYIPTKIQKNDSLNQVVNLATTTPGQFANWKTYQNEKYEFEIKYPPDWNVELREFSDGTLTGGLIDKKIKNATCFGLDSIGCIVAIEVRPDLNNLAMRKIFSGYFLPIELSGEEPGVSNVILAVKKY